MSDDRQEPLPDDATHPLPPADRPSGGQPLDATARQAPLDATARQEPLDATARQEPADRTRQLPPAAATPPEPNPAVWSGRAGVPPPRPPDYSEPMWYGEEQREPRWWMPILLGILALLLLGVLGGGVWLAVRTPERDEAPTPPPAPTSAPVTTAAPTSAAPTTEPASTPPATEVVPVPMPPLVGLPGATAERILDRLDLSYRVETRESSEQVPGTVVETDPEAGAPVGPGEEVTLVVAAAPSPSPPGGEPGEPTAGATTTP
ncbi:PASTA domain-containing protein [Micromonospora sp. KC606]|uniref:PASTA domain-containing protein n=1 Tax=Micromonospora sp. KC606 TaxID=2530379 RepID=UPI0010518F08|nr:PASTA domain-containing protein [Micromonospora sp. KC606]TDC82946.1 PASTA domain-containing protein [Micromonospora sp. KC606]